MKLSVLSALARGDIDPWEEAGRLAAMPRANATSELISRLDLTSAKYLNPSDAEKIAMRLVRLLPRGDDGSAIASTGATRIVAQQKNHWLVWLGFGIAISLLSQQHQATTTDAVGPAAKSSATSQMNAARVNDTSSAPHE
jgi:hypothetical protein